MIRRPCWREIAPRLFDHSLFNAHPRFFGYITAPPAPIGILGDFLASALNANVGAWRLSPAATEIEIQTVRWIARADWLSGRLRRPAGQRRQHGQHRVPLGGARRAAPGGTCASTGLAAAGGARSSPTRSAETHTWIQKAADIAGLGTDVDPLDPDRRRLRMDVAALRPRPSIATSPPATARSWSSARAGRSAPASSIRCRRSAALCRERGIWFHVDGAYGGFAAAVPDAPDALRALSLADSVAVDPHKWLYAPLEAGCALVRDPARLRAAFAYHPPYYHFGEHGTNFVDYGPQNSRGFRALKVWLALRQAGAAGYRQMIGDDIRLSRAHGRRGPRAPASSSC